jgi:hypothetical protein
VGPKLLEVEQKVSNIRRIENVTGHYLEKVHSKKRIEFDLSTVIVLVSEQPGE